jgi:acyl carrier protein
MNEEVLAKIIERAAPIWGVDPAELGADTTFASMNTKSTHISQITTYLEDEYDAEVPYIGFKKCKTLGEAAAYVVDLLEE